MDASSFAALPDHVGFTAKNLFTGRQGSLARGDVARMEPGGGGPTRPHRHAHAHLFIVMRGTATVLRDGVEHEVGAHESLLVPGGSLHAVWNKGRETTEIIGLTLEDTPASPSSPAP